MSRKNIFELIFSVAFAGVILSFGLYFILTLSLRPDYNINEDYFDGKTVERSYFSDFDDACLKNRSFHEKIIKTEYKLFGNIFGENVIKGKNGFLFMSGINQNGYDYIADYTGESQLYANDLEKIYQYIEMRNKAYKNRNVRYYLAVLPNSQTVYSEYMPDIYGEKSKSTGLERVEAYLEEKGFEQFIDLTDCMTAAKVNGLLYNNTENSINALGAYYAYAGIMDFLAKDIDGTLERIMEREFFDLYTHYTDGKAAAELAGISSFLQNETISMSNATEYMYTTVEIFEDLETTYTKNEYRSEIPLKPSVLLEVTSEWDKIQLKPYFSNTFGMVSYRASHNFSTAALDNSNPTIVIQILHEDELLSVIDPAVSTGYEDGLAPGQNPYKTMKPRGVEFALTNENTVSLTGEVESGSEVWIFGDDIEACTVGEIGGRFVATVSFSGSAYEKEIFVSAKVDKKTVSDPVNIITSAANLAEDATGDALVGLNSMIYLPDYGIGAIPDSDVLDTLYERLESAKLQASALAGEKTKLIYALIPEKLSVYRTGAPEELTEQISDMETLRSLLRMRLEKAGFLPMDMAEILIDKAKNEKMFNQSNEKLTDMAYYYMYRALTEMISEDFPTVSHTRIEDIRSYTYLLSNGRHAVALGFEKYGFIEQTAKLVITTEAVYTQAGATGNRIDKTKAFVSRRDGDGLPTAIIVRDSVGTGLLDLLSEHFSEMHVLDENNTEIENELLSSVAPDYIIYLFDEGNMGSLLEN